MCDVEVMAEPLRVVAAVIIRDGCVLACRRNPDRSAGGLWEFPGGKVEPGESPEGALAREIEEELGVGLAGVAEFGVFEAEAFGHGRNTGLHMTCFRAELTGEPQATGEIAEFRYFTVSEYAAMEHVAPGSMMVFQRLHELDLIDW